ncbi:MAG TPA: uL15 family ribosomal protein [Candidatus Nitrosotenuis sp.]|nr:uL15 family ribosomal protein [Candidatus Nitrosotenuis sp.]
MATRLRKTRKFRGSRTHGWGQIGQHRASGHKGGLGQSGLHKHLYSTLLKFDPDHFGHDSTHPPHPNIIKKWASVRDLDDLYAKHGKLEGNRKLIDLTGLGYDKLLGGGQVKNAYLVKVEQYTASAEDKIKKVGGEVLAVG